MVMKARTKSIGILFLIVFLLFYVLGGYLNYRLLEVNWGWYCKLVSSPEAPLLIKALAPRTIAGLTIGTFIPVMVSWILNLFDDNAKYRLMIPVVFNSGTLLIYYSWMYVFFVKKCVVLACLLVLTYLFLVIVGMILTCRFIGKWGILLIPFIALMTFFVYEIKTEEGFRRYIVLQAYVGRDV